MDLYLRNRMKAAKAAAARAAAGNQKPEKETRGIRLQKSLIAEVGASHLLDLPLGVKLPVLPGTKNVFYTTNISETLYKPSFDFNLTDPYCRLLETSYKSLHDPHLKTYYKRKDILRRLKKDGYITSDNKVVCSLREFNKYRQYLITLKTDFEKNYIREQKMIEKQVNKLCESKKVSGRYDAARFQKWLLQESKQATPHQEQLIKCRYLDMISKELDKTEKMTERRNTVWIKEEERQHQDHIRRKLNLRRHIEEEWPKKEMLLLSKIGEEVRREAKVDEQHWKIREIHEKRQALLEKKIAYHLQKMQSNDSKRERSKENTFKSKEQAETASASQIKRTAYVASDKKAYQEHLEPKRSTQHAQNHIKISVKTSTTLSPLQGDVQDKTTEKKKDEEMTKTLFPSNDRGIIRDSVHVPVVSSKISNVPRQFLPDIPKQKVNGQNMKKLSTIYETDLPVGDRITPSYDSSIKQQTHYQDHWQEKTANRNSFQNLSKTDISKVEPLKDAQNKKDLVIPVVAHDIDQKVSENKIQENIPSDEDEVVLQEVVNEDFFKGVFEDQIEKDIKPIAKTVASTEQPVSRSLKKFPSSTKCWPKSSTSESSERIPTQLTESEEIGLKRILTELDLTISSSSIETNSSSLEKRTPSSVEVMKSSTESIQVLMYRIMSFPSFNEDDLPSFNSSDEDRSSDPSAKITEDSLADLDPERSDSIKFTTLFRRESILGSEHSSVDDTSDLMPSTSKQGSEVMKKVSSGLSKVSSRLNANISKSSLPSPPHPEQDRS